MLDFIVASTLALIGIIGLSAVVTETLELNREIESYGYARNALADYRARWRIAGAVIPGSSQADLCLASTAAWQADWCATLTEAGSRFLEQPRACLVNTGTHWQLRIGWHGAGCADGDAQQARMQLQ